MNLRDYINSRMEEENRTIKNPQLRFAEPQTAEEIVALYRTYDGLRRKMRPLNEEKVHEYLDKGFAFAGAYYDKQLAGVVVSKQFPENYPYFTLPKEEEQGEVYTLGGLFVRPDFQGFGIASRLSKIITQGTENFGKETGGAVGIGYEVSYDNQGSLKILSQFGNYIGTYEDKEGEEGLSVMLYRPFGHEPVKIDRPTIELSQDQDASRISLTEGLQYIGSQEGVGGVSEIIRPLENGNEVTSLILNNTANTIPEPTFDFVM